MARMPCHPKEDEPMEIAKTQARVDSDAIVRTHEETTFLRQERKGSKPALGVPVAIFLPNRPGIRGMLTTTSRLLASCRDMSVG